MSVAVWVAGVAGIESCLPLSAGLLDESVVDGVWGVVVQAAVVVVGVVVREERRHVVAGVLEVPEPSRKVQVVLDGFEQRFRVRVVIGDSWP